MEAIQQAAEAGRSRRIVRAAPLDRPEEFVRSVAALSAVRPLIDQVEGYIGRNDNWRVPTAEGRDLFVKRLVGEPEHVAARLDRILAFQDWLAAAQPTEVHTVPFHGVDREQGLIVFEFLAGSRTAAELLVEEDFGSEMAYRIGRALGQLHQAPQPEAASRYPGQAGESSSGGIGSLYALTPEAYADCSGGEMEAWAMLQHDQVLIDAIDALRARSAQAPVTATHGDIRLDQFLVVADRFSIIDWEEFSFADPARDAGGFVGELLHRAASKAFAELDVDAGLAPGEAHTAVVAAGADQLAKIRDHIVRFWAGYQETGTPDPAFAERATAYAGWHFFDRLLAGAIHGGQLSAAERGMAGIGRNALTQPEHFAATIGLDQV